MRREFHVRFCEGEGVRFPSATRLIKKQILPVIEGTEGAVGLEMMRKYMTRWAATGRIARKAKASPTPRRKRK
jgi:hypothetical protein